MRPASQHWLMSVGRSSRTHGPISATRCAGGTGHRGTLASARGCRRGVHVVASRSARSCPGPSALDDVTLHLMQHLAHVAEPVAGPTEQLRRLIDVHRGVVCHSGEGELELADLRGDGPERLKVGLMSCDLESSVFATATAVAWCLRARRRRLCCCFFCWGVEPNQLEPWGAKRPRRRAVVVKRLSKSRFARSCGMAADGVW